VPAVLQTTAPQSFINTGDLTVHTNTGVVVDAGTNRALLVAISGEGNSTATPASWGSSVTYGGVALTNLGRVRGNAWSWAELWYLVNPAVGTASLVTTLASSDMTIIGSLVLQGVDQTTPFRTTVTAGGGAATGTSSSVTVGSVAADDLVVDVLTIDSTGHSDVVGADQTEVYDLILGANVTTSVVSRQLGSAGGVMSHSWTTAAIYCHLATAAVGVPLVVTPLFPSATLYPQGVVAGTAIGAATVGVGWVGSRGATLSTGTGTLFPAGVGSGTFVGTGGVGGGTVGLRQQGVVAANLTGTAAGSGAITGALTAASSLSGTAAATSSAVGAVTAGAKISASAAGQGAASGSLAAAAALSSTAAGVGTSTGALTATSALTASAAGAGTIVGALAASAQLSATAAGSGTAVGTLAATRPISGALAGYRQCHDRCHCCWFWSSHRTTDSQRADNGHAERRRNCHWGADDVLGAPDYRNRRRFEHGGGQPTGRRTP
jgi:hypothetical protein